MSRFEIRLSAAQSIVTDAENRWLSAGGATQEIVLHLMQTLVSVAGFEFFGGYPSNVGSASPGSSTQVARGDHVHAHGNQAGGSLHSAATTVAAGFMSAVDKLKLDEIETGATQNASDLHLTNRANHYGTQAISTVSGLQAELDDLAADIAGLASTAGTVTSVAVQSGNPVFAVTGSPITGAGTINIDFEPQPAGLVMASAPTGSGSGTPYLRALVPSDIPALSYITSAEKGAASGVAPLGADSKVPSAYLPATSAGPTDTDELPEGAVNLYYTDARAETVADAVLAAHTSAPDPHPQYRDAADDVPWTEISGAPATFPPSAHTHAIADVTGLQTALDGKLATGGEAATVATIAGRVSAGTNVTITGAGTAASPYQIAAAGGGGSPAGLNTQVQFNDGGALGADADLTYDKSTITLNVENIAVAAIKGQGSTGLSISAGVGLLFRSIIVDPGNPLHCVIGSDVEELLHTGNTKTVNGQSIAGSGDISVSGGMYPRFIRYKDSWAHLLTQGSITSSIQTIFNTTANRVYYWPICRTHAITIENLCIFYDSTVDGQVGIYSNDTTGGYDHPGTLLASASATGSDIKDVVLSTPVNVSAGDLVWFAYTNAGAYRIRGTAANGYSSLQPSIDRVTAPSFPQASMYLYENKGSFGLPASAASSLVKALNTSGPILPSVFFKI